MFHESKTYKELEADGCTESAFLAVLTAVAWMYTLLVFGAFSKGFLLAFSGATVVTIACVVTSGLQLWSFFVAG